jgi:hypothetical protein
MQIKVQIVNAFIGGDMAFMEQRTPTTARIAATSDSLLRTCGRLLLKAGFFGFRRGPRSSRRRVVLISATPAVRGDAKYNTFTTHWH